MIDTQRIAVADHTVDRFFERFDQPVADREDAKAFIKWKLRNAVLLGIDDEKGQRWKSGRMVLATQHDSEADHLVIVSVWRDTALHMDPRDRKRRRRKR